MGEPRPRIAEARTEPDRPEPALLDDAARRRLLRDLPPPSAEGPSLSDPDAQLSSDDPLDAHKPGMHRNDPLDPDGHVI
ncbi:hypothetical protein ASD23_03365 [Agromyces sp. Root1464]|jgi:hypothetical protein|uniref:hypothetical protein n=1 Tax=Agromyces sp. Root1464 TaxID=1736467 RepID=UPI0006FD8DC1|nr:hypothetical protein [Agromyces sp. Root1464]KQZ11152.1 hypothetical protein ASD23_03365 [Agromyces sp. Root1464]